MSDWFLLPHLEGVRIEGEDAHVFAHAQFTSAFDIPSPDRWRLTAWCNPKGRVIATLLARSCGPGVDLLVPASQAAELVGQLQRYAIGRKVSFRPGLAVSGCLSEATDGTCLEIDPQRRLELNHSGSQSSDESAQAWRLHDLRAGVAWLQPQTSARFLPQALGLEARGGLSYRKGCYPGQEIIARVHYLGRSTERLSGFRQSAGPNSADDRLVDESGKPIGSVIECRQQADQLLGLAVVASELPELAQAVRSGLPVALMPPESLW